MQKMQPRTFEIGEWARSKHSLCGFKLIKLGSCNSGSYVILQVLQEKSNTNLSEINIYQMSRGLRKSGSWRRVKKLGMTLCSSIGSLPLWLLKGNEQKERKNYLHEKGSGVVRSPSKAKVNGCCLWAPLPTLLFMQFEFWLLRSFKLFSERLLSCSFSKGYNFLSKL